VRAKASAPPTSLRPSRSTLEGLGDEDILTPNDLAVILKITPHFARRLFYEGKICGAFRVGSLWRICVKDVRAWIESERLPKNKEIFEIHRRIAEHEANRAPGKDTKARKKR
jgi:hypothetical protein